MECGIQGCSEAAGPGVLSRLSACSSHRHPLHCQPFLPTVQETGLGTGETDHRPESLAPPYRGGSAEVGSEPLQKTAAHQLPQTHHLSFQSASNPSGPF